MTLDDILSLLDRTTRRNFQAWMRYQAAAIAGRGEQINASLATFEPFVEHANQLRGHPRLPGRRRAGAGAQHRRRLQRARRPRPPARRADRQRRAHLPCGLGIKPGVRRSVAQALPPFEASSTVALRTLDRFSVVASPYLDEVRPVERQLTQLLQAAKPFAPQFNSFLTALGPLTTAAKRGLPYTATVLNLTVPVLENLRPVLHNFDPFLQSLGEYVPELQAFFANLTAASEASGANGSAEKNGKPQGPREHYLRAMLVFSPQSLAIYPQRVGTDRSNPYFKPGAFHALGSGGLQVFSNSSCANSAPSVSGPPNEAVSQSLIELILQFKVANAPETPNAVAAPGCNQQGPVHLQRPDQPVPARHLRRKMMTEEQGLSNEYEFHSDSGELDLTGDPATGKWSIRCIDVHKRLGGVPVLNGLNVAFPDETITVVLGPSGTGKSVLIKHIIGLMFPDSGDVIVQGQSVPTLTMPQLLGAAPQSRRALPGRRPVRVDVGVRQRRLPAASAHRLPPRRRSPSWSPNAWPTWGWPTRWTICPRSSPAACASVPGSRGRW